MTVIYLNASRWTHREPFQRMLFVAREERTLLMDTLQTIQRYSCPNAHRSCSSHAYTSRGQAKARAKILFLSCTYSRWNRPSFLHHSTRRIDQLVQVRCYHTVQISQGNRTNRTDDLRLLHPPHWPSIFLHPEHRLTSIPIRQYPCRNRPMNAVLVPSNKSNAAIGELHDWARSTRPLFLPLPGFSPFGPFSCPERISTVCWSVPTSPDTDRAQL